MEENTLWAWTNKRESSFTVLVRKSDHAAAIKEAVEKAVNERDEDWQLKYEILTADYEQKWGLSMRLERRIVELESTVKRLEEACLAAIPCLEEWIDTTGFGSVNRRDKTALALIQAALAGGKEAEGQEGVEG